jgi:hypothetical protein
MPEALYSDGSYAQPGVRAGGLAVRSLSLFAACQALEVWLKQADEGKPAKERWQLTRDGHRLAVLNVIEPMTGKQFASPTGRCGDAACRKALAAGRELLAQIDADRVILTD